MDRHRRAFNLLLNAVVTLSAVVVGFTFWTYIAEPHLTPVPYDEVEITSFEKKPDGFTFVANFTKLACQIDRVSAVGGLLRETQVLSWIDEDGLPQDYDRGQGAQTLHMTVYTAGQNWNWVEIRARHYCEGQRVDTVFWRFEEELRT